MEWSVAEAKQKFSEVLRASNDEPQQILNRGRLVAAVVDAVAFQKFQAWQKQQETCSLADTFAKLRKICQDEKYTLAVPPRRNRRNSFAEGLSEAVV